ncbi:MAG: hypothetical protein ACK5F5_09730 [Gammaproteobacteria bacterium]|jgi:hypothetical protein
MPTPTAAHRPAPIARIVAIVAAALLVDCAAPGTGGTAGAVLPSPPVTDAAFCREAQRAIVGTALAADNEVITDFEAFVKSKPVARPLQTRQFVHTEDGVPGRPRMISCKMKTADHLVTEHGAASAGADIGCSGVNRLTLERVLASMRPAERRRLRYAPQQVVFDEDIVTTQGQVWVAPFPMARLADDGTLHIRSLTMRNDWLDPRYASAPPQFKGTRYCHLIAPEHLGRLLRGEVAPDR